VLVVCAKVEENGSATRGVGVNEPTPDGRPLPDVGRRLLVIVNGDGFRAGTRHAIAGVAVEQAFQDALVRRDHRRVGADLQGSSFSLVAERVQL
jgi:hypothetical protein